jgi:uncharacterized protein YecE (DUF72 family)
VPEPDPERYLLATELAARTPERAIVGNVRCGTAGWTDPTLIRSGAFYPKKTMSARERLEHYAGHFSFVEVNATYYSLLPPENAEHWLRWTRSGFVFDVKAHPVLTAHPIDLARLPPDLKAACATAGHTGRVYPERLPAEIAVEIESRFRAFLAPLLEAGRLGAVLLQFPRWFVPSRDSVRHIENVADRLRGVPLAVEFRNGSWLDERGRERTLSLLGRHHLTYVCVDEPAIASGVPPLTAVTNPELAIVRFHGQNSAGWSKRGASVVERFDYLYTPDELARWVAPVRELAAQASEVHATFNNCARDYAVVNAKDLAALLAQELQTSAK